MSDDVEEGPGGPAAPPGAVDPAASAASTASAAADAIVTPAAAPRRGRTRSWPLAAVGLGLLVIGAGTLAWARPPERGVPTAAPNVAVDAGAADPTDLRQHNSPSIAADPTRAGRLAVVNRIDNPMFGCSLHVSTDDGATWDERQLPFPAGEDDPPRCYAPDVGFGADGALHVSFVTLAGQGNVPNAAWVATSRDVGGSFSEPVRVAGRLAFQVRLAADPDDADRLYVTWLQAGAVGTLLFPETGYPVTMARSDDGGRTWGDPTRVSPADRLRVVAPVPAVAGGALFVAYLDLGDDVLDYHGAHEGRGGEPYPGKWSLVLARSSDGGATWSDTVVDDGLVPTQRIVVFLPPSPSLVVDDEARRVHLAFTDGRQGDADVWVWTSTDGGRSFGPPRRVNDTPRGDGTSQYLPRLGLSADGRLDVLYYDRRLDEHDAMNGVSLQSSSDGGRTFGPRLVVSDRAFDSRIGFGSERDLPDLGSRLGLLSSPRRVVAVWSDTRGGTRSSGKQDLATSIVTLPEPGSDRSALRVVGALLTVVGALVAALAVAGRRAADP